MHCRRIRADDVCLAASQARMECVMWVAEWPVQTGFRTLLNKTVRAVDF